MVFRSDFEVYKATNSGQLLLEFGGFGVVAGELGVEYLGFLPAGFGTGRWGILAIEGL